jgi:hypothetical protein
MANIYYTPTGTPATGSPEASAPIRAEFAAISAAFSMLPSPLAGRAGAFVVVNSTGTALITTTTPLSSPGPIGNVVPSTGAFTNITAANIFGGAAITTPALIGYFGALTIIGEVTFSGNVSGPSFNGQIGNVTPSTGNFTTLSAVGEVLAGSLAVHGISLGAPPQQVTIETDIPIPSATRPVGSIYIRKDGGIGTTLYISRGAGVWRAVAGV